jgi:hypothetical protein
LFEANFITSTYSVEENGGSEVFWNIDNHLQEYNTWTLNTEIQIFTVPKTLISYIKNSVNFKTKPWMNVTVLPDRLPFHIRINGNPYEWLHIFPQAAWLFKTRIINSAYANFKKPYVQNWINHWQENKTGKTEDSNIIKRKIKEMLEFYYTLS